MGEWGDFQWLAADRQQDYYATIYSAEIVNTLTNLLFMYLAFKGITNCVWNGHDTVFLIAFCGYLVVGVGSFLFHSTLKCKKGPRCLRSQK
jgi:dihydroceramidase